MHNGFLVMVVVIDLKSLLTKELDILTFYYSSLLTKELDILTFYYSSLLTKKLSSLLTRKELIVIALIFRCALIRHMASRSQPSSNAPLRRCCQCNGSAKCLRCACVRSDTPCSHCLPGETGRCFNTLPLGAGTSPPVPPSPPNPAPIRPTPPQSLANHTSLLTYQPWSQSSVLTSPLFTMSRKVPLSIPLSLPSLPTLRTLPSG